MYRNGAQRLSAVATLIAWAIVAPPILAQTSGTSPNPSARSQKMPMHDPAHPAQGTSPMRMPAGSGMTPSPESSSLPLPLPRQGQGRAGGMPMPAGGGSGSMGEMEMSPGVVGMPASGGIRLPRSVTGLTIEQL